MVFCVNKLRGPRTLFFDFRDKMVKETHGHLNVWTLEFKDPQLKEQFAEIRQK